MYRPAAHEKARPIVSLDAPVRCICIGTRSWRRAFVAPLSASASEPLARSRPARLSVDSDAAAPGDLRGTVGPGVGVVASATVTAAPPSPVTTNGAASPAGAAPPAAGPGPAATPAAALVTIAPCCRDEPAPSGASWAIHATAVVHAIP